MGHTDGRTVGRQIAILHLPLLDGVSVTTYLRVSRPMAIQNKRTSLAVATCRVRRTVAVVIADQWNTLTTVQTRILLLFTTCISCNRNNSSNEHFILNISFRTVNKKLSYCTTTA